jgi:glycosyltransferase involved in cell wall biosynthesis
MFKRDEPDPVDLVIVLPSLGAGGTERVTSILANHWASEGRRLALFLTEPDNRMFFDIHPDVGITRIELKTVPPVSRLFPRLTTLFSILRLRNFLISTSTTTVLSFLPGPNVISIIAAWGLGIRTIISERNSIQHRKLPRVWQFLRRITYRQASLITINLEANRPILKIWCPKSRIVLLPNPISVSKPSSRSQGNGQTILAVGRLSKQKAFDVLIEAFAKSDCSSTGWHLQIVGQGEEQLSLQDQITNYRLESTVTISPFTGEVWAEFGHCNFFVMPSHYEGMPNALLEAIAVGLVPVVSEGVGDIAKKLIVYDSRLVFQSGNVAQLTSILNFLRTEPNLPLSFSKTADKLIAPYRLSAAIPAWTQTVFPPRRSGS